ncbi:hypothetical protein ACOMHN_022622 [Nucella lapillus]
MAGKRKYYDLRYMFMRGLQAHERMQRGKHYLKSAAECTSKAIVSLELSEKNVNTTKQAVRLEGIGAETVHRLEGYVNTQVYGSDRPAPGRFVSSAGALLVALLNLTELAVEDSQGGVTLIPEEALRSEAAKLCDERFLPAQSPGFCQAWWRLEVLIRRDLVKRRSLHKASVYHLLPLGLDKALSLRERSLGQEPAIAVKHVLTDAMYSNDKGLDGVVLLVDIQEGGGNGAGLADLCEMIEQTGTVYRTRKLPCADYNWLWRCDGVDRQLPFLLERKRADDVAFSLKDGRFWGQMDKMRAKKELFEQKGVQATLQYIVEGKPENFVVRCADGCQGIGRCGNPTLQQVQRVLRDLKQHPHLTVVAMDSMLDTVRHLADTTSKLRDRAERGEFDALVIAEMTAASTPEPRSSYDNKINPVIILNDDDDDEENTSESITHDKKTSNTELNQTPNKSLPRNLEKQKQEQNFKGRNSSLLTDGDYDELPPLVLAQRGEHDVNKENGSVGQVVDGPCRGSHAAVPLTTAGGSPRGRVYLMKRKAGKCGPLISPNKKPLISEDGNPPVTGTNAPSTAGKEDSTDRQTPAGIPSGEMRETPRHSASHSRPRLKERSESPLSTFSDRTELWKDASQLLFSSSPPPHTRQDLNSSSQQSRLSSPDSFVCRASLNKPSVLDKLPSGRARSAGGDSPVRATTSQKCHRHPDWDVKGGSVLNNGLPPSSGSGLRREGKERLVTSGDNGFCNDKNFKDFYSSTASDEEFSFYSVTYPHLLPITPSPLEDDKSVRGNIKPEERFPVVNSHNGAKDHVRTSCASQDGSDSDDSLPDIDLSVGLSSHQPSHTISSSASPLHAPDAGEEGRRQITSRPRGSNSQEKKSGAAAPSLPQTADSCVQSGDKIAQIAVVFPQMRGSQIAEVLRRFDGNLERCVIGILEDPELVEV